MVLVASVILALSVGCSGTPDGKGSAPDSQAGQPAKTDRDDQPSQQQLAKLLKEFDGVKQEHALDLWRAEQAANKANLLYTAYYTQRPTNSPEESQKLLKSAIESSRKAKELVKQLCDLYPDNVALGSTYDAVLHDLRSLESQKKK